MLRDYQQQAVDTLFKYWGSGKTAPVCLQAPTSFGKSWVVAEIVKKMGQPALILQPSKEILEQNYEKLLLSGVPEDYLTICSASAGSWVIGGITLATIGTIAKHYDKCGHFQLVVIDELDCVPLDSAKSQYLTFLGHLKEANPNLRVVGLSASPFRNQVWNDKNGTPTVYCRPVTRIYTRGGKKTPFGEWFWSGGIIYKCGIPELQARGFLSPTEYYQAETDWSFVKSYPGRTDYDTEEMTQWMSYDANLTRFHQAVEWCKNNDFKTIVFTPNIDMNYRLTNCIRDGGGTAEMMDSNSDSRKTRTAKMEAFRRGNFQFLVNVGMVSRGVDVPSVDAILMCRPTKSLGWYIQAVGRALRKDPSNPNKVARILDLSGNVARFGKVEDIQLTKEKAISRNGWEFEKDIITIKRGDRRYKWEKVG